MKNKKIFSALSIGIMASSIAAPTLLMTSCTDDQPDPIDPEPEKELTMGDYSAPKVQNYTVTDATKTLKFAASSGNYQPFGYLVMNDEISSNPQLLQEFEDVIELCLLEMNRQNVPYRGYAPITSWIEDGSETNIQEIITTLRARDQALVIELDSNFNEHHSDEAYRIDISNYFRLTARTTKGILYGMRTLMSYYLVGKSMQYGYIIDYPDVAERSVHLDMARKYYSADWIKQLIADMSYNKLNTLQLHFSDHAGLRLQTDDFTWNGLTIPLQSTKNDDAAPFSTEWPNGKGQYIDPSYGNSSDGFILYPSDPYITQAEMIDIISFANKYHVEIIPAFDSPGHLEHILNRLKQYDDANETTNGRRYFDNFPLSSTLIGNEVDDEGNNIYQQLVDTSANALNITDDDALDFITQLYNYYGNFFYSLGCKKFHIGGDEFIDFGKAKYFSALEQYAQNIIPDNLNGTWIDTYAYFLNNISDSLKTIGYESTRVWSDGMYRKGVVQNIRLNQDIQVDYWTGWNKDMATIEVFLQNGHKIKNVNDSYMYYVVNVNYSKLTAPKIFEEWNPGVFPNAKDFEGETVEQTYSMHQYESWLTGTSLAIWSDMPSWQTCQQVADGIYWPMRAMATRSWNAKDNTYDYGHFSRIYGSFGGAPEYYGYFSDIEYSRLQFTKW